LLAADGRSAVAAGAAAVVTGLAAGGAVGATGGIAGTGAAVRTATAAAGAAAAVRMGGDVEALAILGLMGLPAAAGAALTAGAGAAVVGAAGPFVATLCTQPQERSHATSALVAVIKQTYHGLVANDRLCGA